MKAQTWNLGLGKSLLGPESNKPIQAVGACVKVPWVSCATAPGQTKGEMVSSTLYSTAFWALRRSRRRAAHAGRWRTSR
eukprot:3837160-Rhodomonas_salina.1